MTLPSLAAALVLLSTPAAAGIAQGKLLKGVRTFDVSVTEDGFVPARMVVEQGEKVRLVVTRRTNTTCATELVMKDRGLNVPLPLGKAATVEFTAGKSGELAFACAMGHVGGVVFVR